MQAPASSPADAPVDVSPDERWMTLLELGQMRGISKASAARLVRRHKWRRQADNQGRVRVLVPIYALTQADVRLTDRADAGADMSAAIGTLREAVAALREQLTRAEAGREAEHVLADALREQLDEMQAALDQARRDAQAAQDALADEVRIMRSHLVAAEVAVDQARRGARAAEEPAEAVRQADAARRPLGRLARIRAAWRGE